MATLLNQRLLYLTSVAKSLREAQIDDEAVIDRTVKAKDLSFGKMNDAFAGALLATQLRAVYPQIGATALAVTTAAFNVNAQLAGVAESAAAPVFDSANTRTWSNLGACTYAAGDANLVTVKDADGDDVIQGTTGYLMIGRLTKNAGAGGNEYQVTFYWRDLTSATDMTMVTDQEMTATGPVTMWYKRWVAGDSTLLQDPAVRLFSNAQGVDATERANLDQIMANLGFAALDGTGIYNLGYTGNQTFKARVEAHWSGTGDQHVDDKILVTDGVITGLANDSNLYQALVQIQNNIDNASSDAQSELQTYFNELRSNGVLGTGAVITDTAGGDLVVNLATARTAYVAGKRFVLAIRNDLAVSDNATTKIWVNSLGTVVTGAAYPDDLDTCAKLASVVAAAGAVTLITDEHRALLELDQKVYDIETLLNSHIASITAHASEDITFDSTTSGMAADDVQAAIDELDDRMDDMAKGEQRYTLTSGDITGASTNGQGRKYFDIDLDVNESYSVGKKRMQLFLDGSWELRSALADGTDGFWSELDTNTVRIYWDPADDAAMAGRVIDLVYDKNVDTVGA